MRGWILATAPFFGIGTRTIVYMTRIDYRSTDIRGLELIRPLWLQLNEHHRALARKFRTHYEQMNVLLKKDPCGLILSGIRLQAGSWDIV